MTETSTTANGNASTCVLWHVEDGGEDWWYAEPNAETAAATHRRICYDAAGVAWPSEPDEQPGVPTEVSAVEALSFQDYGPPGDPHALTTMSAIDWARRHGPGLIATSCV